MTQTDDAIAARAAFRQTITDKVLAGLESGDSTAELTATLIESTKADAKDVASTLRANAPAMVAEHDAMWADVQHSIRDTWGEALDLTYAIVAGAEELLRAWNYANLRAAEECDDVLFAATSALGAGAIRTAFECHHLLTRGFTAGAAARARSLHEMAVTTALLCEFDESDNLAGRFWDHQTVDQRNWARVEVHHNRDQSNLGRELRELERRGSDLEAHHGAGFGNVYGWALPIIPSGRMSFARLEERAGMQRWRPTYKAQNHDVHPSVWGLSLHRESGGIVTSWRLTGLAGPAAATIRSLLHLVADVLVNGHRGDPNQYDILGLAALTDLADIAEDLLDRSEIDAERRVESDELRPPLPDFISR